MGHQNANQGIKGIAARLAKKRADAEAVIRARELEAARAREVDAEADSFITAAAHGTVPEMRTMTLAQTVSAHRMAFIYGHGWADFVAPQPKLTDAQIAHLINDDVAHTGRCCPRSPQWRYAVPTDPVGPALWKEMSAAEEEMDRDFGFRPVVYADGSLWHITRSGRTVWRVLPSGVVRVWFYDEPAFTSALKLSQAVAVATVSPVPGGYTIRVSGRASRVTPAIYRAFMVDKPAGLEEGYVGKATDRGSSAS